jgi:hypothetical protein
MIVVGTYNMSFAGDKFHSDMPGFPSEYSFHLRDTARPRTFWNNAKAHLKYFIEEKGPLAVGLQEMNITTADEATAELDEAIAEKKKFDWMEDQYPPGKSRDGIHLEAARTRKTLNERIENAKLKLKGTFAIQEMIPSSYEMVSDNVETNNAGISIIFNKNRAGNVNKSKCVDNASQGGRPLLMVLTTKNYLFVNMHGAQDPKLGDFEDDFNTYMINNNKNFLQAEVTTFLGDTVPDHIYIMGDFNDRYDAITEFEIKGTKIGYIDESPASCCHNWDSMGKETERDPIQMKKLEGPKSADQLVENASKKVQGKKPSDDKIIIPTEHGFAIADYINKGDKVFAMDADAGKLDIYKSKHNIAEDGGSKASDHELVYMETTEVRLHSGPTAAPAAGRLSVPDSATPAATPAAPNKSWWRPWGGKRKSRKGRKSKKNKKSNRNTKKMTRKTKKRGKK